jgi:hypothetical protein
MTHAAARYVKNVRRIIFIGGGDSMLLHEALKYPNIEKVVGLELDQTVTRKSFKHFRSQPHFDNNKVEWWFGDATKSLLLLPDDYFGSFDLVLVDLSETVMSMSVTKELDVFDALSLLLSPEGVIVKNEMYKDKFNEVFDYTMELYYICPVICDQVLVFGSNNVDFFHAPTYDHGIDTHLYSNMHTPDTRHDLMHHYKKNIAPEEKCSLTSSEDLSLQGTAAGIIEIFDAENVGLSLDESIVNLIKSAAISVGFTATNDPIFENNFGVLVMEEGYISAKVWPDEKYVAFDINLWGRTYKIEDIKAALGKAVGSNDTSSYRVVVGGMYGSNTWKEDQQVVGPKVKQLRNCEKDIVKKGKLDGKLALTVTVEEVVPVTHSKDITAAVVCGSANQECISLKALKGHADVKDVIPIYECPGGEQLAAMVACEAAVLAALTEKLAQSSNPKIQLLVLDESASFKMHQIFNNILVMEPAADEIFDNSFIAMTWSPDVTGQTWRREFLDRLRKLFKWDPAVRVELVLQAGGKSYEAGIFSPAIEHPAYDFDKMESRIRDRLSKSKAKIEIRHIHGALYRFIDPYDPKEFKQADYDLEPGNSQYAAQAPLGRQVVLQLVKNGEKKAKLELSLDKISSFLQEALDQVQIQPTTSEKYSVGDGAVVVASSNDGNFMVVWDGREHVDVNMFTYRQSVELADKFKDAFLNASANTLAVGLRDDQPRGTGHVVNFMSDIV